MQTEELIGAAIVFIVCIAITIKVLKWMLEVLGKIAEKVGKFVLPALAIFFAIGSMQAGAAEAASLAVPGGVILGAIIENSMG